MFAETTPNPNPYEPAAPMADPDRFFGRADVFSFIRQQLFAEKRSHAPALIGQRGIGKTSILLQIPAHLDARTLTTYIDLSQVRFDEPGGLLAVMADGAREALDAAEISTYRLPSIPTDLPPGDLEQWFATTYLETVLSALRRTRQLVFLFDETSALFKAIEQGVVQADLPDLLSQLIAGDDRFKMLFALDLNDESRAEHFTPLADPLLYGRVPYLQAAEADAFIRQPAAPFYEVSEEAAGAIWTLAGGFPYALQVVNHLIFSLSAARNHSDGVTIADVRTVLPQAIEAMDSLYRPVWDTATISEQQVLAGLSVLSENSGGRAVPLVDLRAWLHRETDMALDSDNNSLTAVLRRLEYRDILRAAPGAGYVFTTGLQQQWLFIHGRLPVLSHPAALAAVNVPRKRQSLLPTVVVLMLIALMGTGLIIAIGHFAGNAANGTRGTPTVTLGVDLLATHHALDATHTQAAIPTATNTDTATATPTATSTNTSTATASLTPTPTPSSSLTTTVTASMTSMSTVTPDSTDTASPTLSPSVTVTRSATPPSSMTPSRTPRLTPTWTVTSTSTPTSSATSSPTVDLSAVAIIEANLTLTAMPTGTPTTTATATPNANVISTSAPVTIGVQPTHRLPTAKP